MDEIILDANRWRAIEEGIPSRSAKITPCMFNRESSAKGDNWICYLPSIHPFDKISLVHM
jgi:hypothetical protein